MLRRYVAVGKPVRREGESPPRGAWDSWTFAVEFYCSVAAVKWSRRDERNDMVYGSR